MTESGYQRMTENGFQPVTVNGRQPMTENRFQPITENGSISSVPLRFSENCLISKKQSSIFSL